MRDFTEVRVETYGPGFEIVKESNPRTPYQAKFSLAYVVAAAIVEGAVGLEQFAPHRFGNGGVAPAAIARLLPRIQVTVAPEFTSRYPEAWPARVTIISKDGTFLQRLVEHARGTPQNPASTAVLEEKMRLLVTPLYGEETADEAMRFVNRLPEMSDVSGQLAFARGRE
jgi:2-methylcitrate dehydratase PrpD